MTAPSTRHVFAIATLVTLAAVPVIAHHWGDLRRDPCPALRVELARAAETRDDRTLLAGIARRFLERTGIDGSYLAEPIPLSEGSSLFFVTVQTWDPKSVYHRPAAALVHGDRATERLIEEVEHDGERLPLHRALYGDADPRSGTRAVAAYLLIYEGHLVANPYLAQLRAAPREVFAGSAPMTLLFAGGFVPEQDVARAEAAVRERVIRGWDAFRASCPR